MYTGSDRPTFINLNRYVVRQAVHKWKDLGTNLLKLRNYYKIDMIAADYPHDDVRCFREVLHTWLETTPDASWYQLIRALRSPTVQLDSLADQLEKMLDIKCKIYSNITTNCTL